MTPAMRRGVTVLASLTLAATALGGTAVAQSPGTPTAGGTLVVADWQAASQLNPYFTNAFADTAAYTLSWHHSSPSTMTVQWVADLATEVPSVDNGGLVPGARPPPTASR